MLKGLTNSVRFLSIFQVANANSGHLGMPLGMADVLTILFKNFLMFDPQSPHWPNRDRFVMSGGHGSALLYSLLHLVGYQKMTINELKNFRKFNSCATGHPEYNVDCGIETTTGPLGQGLANAVGMAIEERLLNARFGDECINHYTYVSVGDGDLMEGISHEASSIAGHLALGHLIALFDDNNITIDGNTNISNSDDIVKRYEAYGWHCQQINGHSEDEIFKAIANAKIDCRPSIIFCKTKIGLGTSKEGTQEAHGGALSAQDLENAKTFFDWPYKSFEIPEYIEKTWKSIGNRNHQNCENWYKTQSEKYGNNDFEIPSDINKILRKIKKEIFVSRPYAATRVSFNEIMEKINEIPNFIISGSADLGTSTGCLAKNMIPISKNNFSGNYINYGVREHAMAAIINGISVGKKIRPFAGTFLVFSDYMKPAIRASAIMKIPSVFVFSHDSICVGEDGPTHQPVEQLATLRAIPNLNVFRPADAMETLECFELTLQSSETPSAMILTRQNVLSIRFCGRTNLCKSGGYLLHNDCFDVNRNITIIASGSEVSIALDVTKKLKNSGFSVNVVSMPCFDLFDIQTEEYKSSILGNGLRVIIEASNDLGLNKYLRKDDLIFGVNNFGYSCSGKENFKLFGITSDNIFAKILKKMN